MNDTELLSLLRESITTFRRTICDRVYVVACAARRLPCLRNAQVLTILGDIILHRLKELSAPEILQLQGADRYRLEALYLVEYSMSGEVIKDDADYTYAKEMRMEYYRGFFRWEKLFSERAPICSFQRTGMDEFLRLFYNDELVHYSHNWGQKGKDFLHALSSFRAVWRKSCESAPVPIVEVKEEKKFSLLSREQLLALSNLKSSTESDIQQRAIVVRENRPRRQFREPPIVVTEWTRDLDHKMGLLLGSTFLSLEMLLGAPKDPNRPHERSLEITCTPKLFSRPKLCLSEIDKDYMFWPACDAVGLVQDVNPLSLLLELEKIDHRIEFIVNPGVAVELRVLLQEDLAVHMICHGGSSLSQMRLAASMFCHYFIQFYKPPLSLYQRPPKQERDIDSMIEGKNATDRFRRLDWRSDIDIDLAPDGEDYISQAVRRAIQRNVAEDAKYGYGRFHTDPDLDIRIKRRRRGETLILRNIWSQKTWGTIRSRLKNRARDNVLLRSRGEIRKWQVNAPDLASLKELLVSQDFSFHEFFSKSHERCVSVRLPLGGPVSHLLLCAGNSYMDLDDWNGLQYAILLDTFGAQEDLGELDIREVEAMMRELPTRGDKFYGSNGTGVVEMCEDCLVGSCSSLEEHILGERYMTVCEINPEAILHSIVGDQTLFQSNTVEIKSPDGKIRRVPTREEFTFDSESKSITIYGEWIRNDRFIRLMFHGQRIPVYESRRFLASRISTLMYPPDECEGFLSSRDDSGDPIRGYRWES